MLTGDDVPTVGVLIPTYGEPVAMVLRTVLSVLEEDYPSDRRIIVVSDDAGNPALKFVMSRFPDVAHIETRDADDEVGSLTFLRQAVGLLAADKSLAYVQTVKEAQVSAGDPFCNLDAQFYRSQMLSRNAANAVFPCGSGLVWRRRALNQIGDFPTWNLVEDLQSGVEALRRGWRACYLTIVGAVAQQTPEDVANVVKQRGTWAIDTVRLMVCLAEIRLLILNKPFADRRARQRKPIRAAWRVKLIWIGLAPVYAVATAKAILGGPRRKPIYKVTRKTRECRWYWKETLPHAVLAIMPFAGLVIGIATGRVPSPLVLVSAGYWGLVSSVALGGFVALG